VVEIAGVGLTPPASEGDEWPLPNGRSRVVDSRNMAALSRVRPLVWVALAVLVVSVAVAIFYFVDGHPKHGLAFLGLAVLAGVGAWFASAPDKHPSEG
jgi:hypothetical protein